MAQEGSYKIIEYQVQAAPHFLSGRIGQAGIFIQFLDDLGFTLVGWVEEKHLLRPYLDPLSLAEALPNLWCLSDCRTI